MPPMDGIWRRWLVGACLALALAGHEAAHAEATQVRFARQLGLGYLQFYVMEDQRLVEKQARARGLGEVTVTWTPLGNPTAISDALLSANADIIGIGLPAFLTLWDRTGSTAEVRGVAAMNRQPAYLLTRNPDIRSIRDYSDKDRIALPAPKVSVQAIMLQMIAEKSFGPGQHAKLDHLTVGMAHPDGTTAMLSGSAEIKSHFTSAPFQYQQLQNAAIRKVLSSYDATDGPNTFSVVAAAGKWRSDNPNTYQAVVAALTEAADFIARKPAAAADIFARLDKSKLPVEMITGMIRDPEFSYEAAPQNVMKIYDFMRRTGSLKRKPESWRDLFFPEVHALEGS